MYDYPRFDRAKERDFNSCGLLFATRENYTRRKALPPNDEGKGSSCIKSYESEKELNMLNLYDAARLPEDVKLSVETTLTNMYFESLEDLYSSGDLEVGEQPFRITVDIKIERI
jgi:hypothetical protein